MAHETPRAEISHNRPVSPSSPDPKRTKFTEPAHSLTVGSILNDTQPTPTPATAPLSGPLVSVGPELLPIIQPMAMEPAPASLQVKLLSSTAKAPTRSSAFAAGYDVYASRETVVPAWGKVLVETDLSVAVPMGTYGRVAPRSGLASKHSIDVGAGVIDADYRGPVKVLLFNLSSVDFGVSAGDRVAQLVLERIYTPDVVVVEQLDETVRGAGGFGSTGGFAGATLPPRNDTAGTS